MGEEYDKERAAALVDEARKLTAALKVEAEEIRTVIDKVKKLLDTMAQKENYTLILDAASNRILYGAKSYDLTDRVIEQLNNEESSTGNLAPGGNH